MEYVFSVAKYVLFRLHSPHKPNVAFVILCIISSSIFGYSQNSVYQEFSGLSNSDAENKISRNYKNQSLTEEAPSYSIFQNCEDHHQDYIKLDLNLENYKKIFKDRKQLLQIELPIGNGEFVMINFYKRKNLSDRFRIVSNLYGKLDIDHNDFHFYHGYMEGVDNSVASMSLSHDHLKIMVAHDGGNYFIEEAGLNTYIFKRSDVSYEELSELSCQDLDELELGHSEVDHKNFKTQDPIDIYIETDYDKYLDHGSDSLAVATYVFDLVNESASLFAMSSIDIAISELKIWQSPDPYELINDALNALDKFSEEHYNGFNGDLAHMISGRNLGGGYAWLDELCNSPYQFYEDWDGDGVDELHYGGPFSVSSNHSTSVIAVPTYSWNVQIITHELAHNIGSPHTHACFWGPNGDAALDNCFTTEGGCPAGPPPTNGGTIMSFCHTTAAGINFNNGFGLEPGDHLYTKYSQAPCIPDNQILGETCEEAVVINSSGTYSTDGPSTGYGAHNSDAMHARWFKIDLGQDKLLDIESCNEAVDTRLWIYEGSCDTLLLIEQSDNDCNDSPGSQLASQLSAIQLDSSKIYFIEWDDMNSGAGFNFDIQLYNPVNCIQEDSLDYMLDTGIYNINGALNFNGGVMSNAVVELTSNQEITLEAGFETMGNNEIVIQHKACDNNN